MKPFTATAWKFVGKPIQHFVGIKENLDDCFAEYDAFLRQLDVRGPYRISISPARSMTTWLFATLKADGRVFVPDIKETNFFWNGWTCNRGAFDECRRAAAQGMTVCDISPSYAALPRRAIAILKENFPDLKMLLMLRDPVARMLSHYVFEATRPGGSGLSKRDLNRLGSAGWTTALASFAEAFSPVRILDRWLACYPPDQISIVFCDELIANQGQSPSVLRSFLGDVALDASPAAAGVVNNLDYSGIRIPGDARRFLEAFFSAETLELQQRLDTHFNRAIPDAWHRELDHGPIPICRSDGLELNYMGQMFEVTDSAGQRILRTPDAVSAIGTTLVGSGVEMPAERMLEIHFGAANGRIDLSGARPER